MIAGVSPNVQHIDRFGTSHRRRFPHASYRIRIYKTDSMSDEALEYYTSLHGSVVSFRHWPEPVQALGLQWSQLLGLK
jgi:hypothetical protein